MDNAEETGLKVLARQFQRSKIAAVHFAGVRGKEQETRYLARTGETHRTVNKSGVVTLAMEHSNIRLRQGVPHLDQHKSNKH